MNYKLVRDSAGFYSQVPVEEKVTQEELIQKPVKEPIKAKVTVKKDN